MRLALVCSIFLFISNSQAAIWEHNPNLQWNSQWQDRYADWIENHVDGQFFKRLGLPFSNVRLDCADAQYALIAYFSRQNRLPFAVNNGKTTNLSTRFDHIAGADRRLAAFMKYLRSNFGTESLVHRDTYPPKISELMPGDVFMWKIGKNGSFTRHTYIIKSINRNGTFEVLYSTQANAAKNGPLKKKTQHMFSKAPRRAGGDKNRWGFRRMKMAHQTSWSQGDIPGASYEQYQWARELSSFAFFDRVQKLNQTTSENPQQQVKRLFNTVCSSVQERIDIVYKALERQQELGGTCMNYSDYDAHSTPGRDGTIKKQYQSLEYTMKHLQDSGQMSKVRKKLWNNAFAIFDGATDDHSLYKACPIEFGRGNNERINLAYFYEALFGNQVSFHPNDNLKRRWGVLYGAKTRCKAHYGYSE